MVVFDQRELDEKTLEADFSALGVSVSVVRPDPTAPIQPEIDPDDAYVLTALGEDRVGIVAELGGFCARHQINILDLSTQIDGDDYVMVLLVDLSDAQPLVTVRYQLEQFAEQSGLTVRLQHYDIFKATNEVS